MTAPADPLIRRHAEVIDTVIDGEVVAMSLVTGRTFEMRAQASLLWQLLERPRGVPDLVEQMVSRYDVSDRAACSRDVQAFVDALVDNRLAVVTEP
jgi:hypothetical protein